MGLYLGLPQDNYPGRRPQAPACFKYHYATCTAAEPEIHPSAALKVTNEDCTGVRNLWILTVKYRYKYARCCLVCAFYCHRHMWHYSHSRATNLPTYNPGWDRGGMWCDLGCKGWFWAWQRVQVHFCICLIKEQFLKKWFQKRFLGDSVSSLPFTSKMFHALTPFSCTFWSRLMRLKVHWAILGIASFFVSF